MNILCAIGLIIWLVGFLITLTARFFVKIGRKDLQDELVQSGHAEYYLDQNNNKHWRMKKWKRYFKPEPARTAIVGLRVGDGVLKTVEVVIFMGALLAKYSKPPVKKKTWPHQPTQMPNGAGMHVAHFYASWQQRALAILKVKRVEVWTKARITGSDGCY